MPFPLPVIDVPKVVSVCPDALVLPADVPDATAVKAALVGLQAEGAQRLDPVRFRYLESLYARTVAAPYAVQHILLGRLHVAVAAYRARLAQGAVVPDDAPTPGPVRPFASVYARRRAAAKGVLPELAASAVLAESVASPLAALNQYICQVGRQGAVNPVTTNGDAAMCVATTPLVGSVGTTGGAVAVGAPSGVDAALALGQRVELKSARQFGESWSKLQSARRVEQAIQRAPENAGPFNPHKLMARALAAMREVSPAYLHRFVQQVDALLWLEQALIVHQPGTGSKPKSAKTALSRK